MRSILLTAAALAALAGPALAQEADQPAWTVEWEVGAVSDYRFRGYSLSDGGPAAQGGVTVSAPNGLYAYGWASTIDEYGAGADGKGAQGEFDLGFGYAGSLAGFDFDVSAVRYIYPGGENVDLWELPVSVSRAVGDWTLTVGGAYVPEQDNTGGDNRYVFAGADWTVNTTRPVTLSLVVGHEDGAFADDKTDWSFGARTALGPATVGLNWVDADAADVDGGLVASIKATF
ncbi:MAG: hypothetical protein JWR84_1020 [Caulobacter sp.]|nr:hypothetical protein [Caulobacter sp.]